LADGVLLWQVACEYLAASRKLQAVGWSRSEALSDIRTLQQMWSTVLPHWKLFDRAEQLLGSYSLSFWDSLIIAACLEGGVTRLCSEDFSSYSRIDNLEIVNPFDGS